MPMKNPQDFDIKLRELESFTSYLNGMIADGSFYRLPFRERFRYIRKVKQLYTQLRGPVSPVSLRRLLPIAVLAALVVPIPIGGDAKATPASFLMSCTMDSSLPASSGNLRIQLAGPVDVPNMERATLTVSGPNMATIQREFSGTVDVISILVPEGDNRTFELEAIPDPAEQSFVMRYRGETTVNLQRGQTKEITLEMNPVPIEPSFKAPVKNPFGLPTPLAKGYAFPSLADLDADGDLDLVVGDGYYTGGAYPAIFRYFENVGTPTSPLFSSQQDNPYAMAPPDAVFAFRLADLDGDADLDVLAGFKYSEGLHFFENIGSPQLADFNPGVANPSGLTGGSIFAFPTLGDLDSDGDLDVLLGTYYNSADSFRYYENAGNQQSPNFLAAQTDPAGLSGQVPTRPSPMLVDLDGDGDLDILSGSSTGDLHYFENTGTPASAAFASDSVNPFGLLNVIEGTKALLSVGDLDGDGDTDLVVGEEEYYNNSDLWYFENRAR